MRLICPNCGAQYEVPDDVIPSGGRDVQCSACGHTWFETPGASHMAETGRAQPVQPQARGLQESSDDDRPAPPRRAEPERAPPPPAFDDDEDDFDDEPAAPPAAAGGPRRTLDPAIADLLKEEASREEAQRRAEAETGLQSQPDLGIDDAAAGPDRQREEEARRRMARLKGESAPKPAASGTGARRELLPDIEEINSTLRASSDRAPGGTEVATTPAAPARRRGFRLGFFTVVLAAIGAAGVYSYAAEIAQALPQAAPALTDYVEWVDGLRLLVDLQLQELLARISPPSG